MYTYRFKIGSNLLAEVRATSISAAWFRLGQKYNEMLADGGFVIFMGIKEECIVGELDG